MRKLFYGGVHPDARKELAPPRFRACRGAARAGGRAAASAHRAGLPPLVKPGDAVRKGQRVGDGEGLCVPVHAPVSGIVREIAEYPHATLGRCEAIVIENDGRETPADTEPHGDPVVPDAVGTGGAHPSGGRRGHGRCDIFHRGQTRVRRGRGGHADRQCVRVRALHHGRRRAAVHAAGACRARRTDALGVRRREAHRHCHRGQQGARGRGRARRTAVRDGTEDFAHVLSAGRGEAAHSGCDGREAAAGKLPRDVGCAVFNAATCAASVRAAFDGEPLIERIVTVSGEGVKHPGNYLVRIGTPIADVLAAAGGLADDGVRVLAGGR